MIGRWIHPRSRELNRFADRELEGEERQRVASHLAGCARCRETVRFIRSVSEAADELSVPAARPELLDRVLSRRAAGDRVILPVATPPHTPSGLRRVGPYAAAAILLVAAAALVTVATLRADRSVLEFKPSAPGAGAEITAEYRGALFAEDERLHLRAEFHYLDGRRERVAVGELESGRGGVRRATFRLPDSVVYVQFAVEDSEARRVDSNHHRLWALLVHESDGRPAFRALAVRMDDLVRRNWEGAYEAALEMVEIYPDEVESWDRLLMTQQPIALRATETHAAPEIHRERFKAFEERFQRKSRLTPEELAALFYYAYDVGDPVAAEYWRERLIAKAPGHPASVQIQAENLSMELRGEPLMLLTELDELWRKFGPVHEQVAVVGYRTAVWMQDPQAIGAWASRYLEFRSDERGDVATTMLEYPELREDGLRWLQLELERLDAPDHTGRLLTETASAYESWRARRSRSALVALADGLVQAGDIATGLEALNLAMRRGWEPELFPFAVQTYLLAGDTVSALPVFARLASDPDVPHDFADSVRARVGRHFPSDWPQLVERARGEMRQHVLAQAELRYLPDEVPILSADGGSHDLRLLTQGNISIVAFWSRFSYRAIADLPWLLGLTEDLEKDGAKVVVITREPPSRDFFEVARELGVDELPVYHDIDDMAQRAFSQSGLPAYYVMDSRGRVRFANSSLAEIRRQVLALRLTEAMPTMAN